MNRRYGSLINTNIMKCKCTREPNSITGKLYTRTHDTRVKELYF